MLLVLVFASALSFSQDPSVRVLVSNATYGGKIYVLAYNDMGPLAGEIHAISPSNLVKSATLAAGQATFDANEIGRWDVYFQGKLYPAYVTDSATGTQPPVQPASPDWLSQLLTTAISLPAFAVVLGLILIASLIFIYFSVNSYSAHQFRVKKSVSHGKVTVSIKNNGADAHKVLLLDFYEEGGRLMCVQKKIGHIASGRSAVLTYPAGRRSNMYSAKVALLSTASAGEVSDSGEKD